MLGTTQGQITGDPVGILGDCGNRLGAWSIPVNIMPRCMFRATGAATVCILISLFFR